MQTYFKIKNGRNVTPESSFNLFGMEIDDKVNFNEYVSNLCIKVSRQLNAMHRLQSYMNQKVIISFVYSNFNEDPFLIWHFSNKQSQEQNKKSRKGAYGSF